MDALVFIPVFKTKPSPAEQASFRQCMRILGHHPVALVAPEALDISAYSALAQGRILNCEYFDACHFRGPAAWSRLLLTPGFYRRFSAYRYLLQYHLDAWVFTDELMYWCRQKYDYIGAPWFRGFEKASEDCPMLPFAGNGGFSLRNVQATLAVLHQPFIVPLPEFLASGTGQRRISGLPLAALRYLRQYRKRPTFWKHWIEQNVNEDYLFALEAPRVSRTFRVAPPEVAMHFSFETQPRRLYALSGKRLPFGCHAFEKFDPAFWAGFIRQEE